MFRIAPILLFMCLILPFRADAATPPAYVVNDVKVDIVAESAVKARNEAFAAAQTQAFKMLSQRFTGAEQVISLPDPDAIAGMVADFEVTSEQLSKRRYLGTYIFRFKPAAVNRYFGHGPVAATDITEAPQQRMIVVPTFTQNNKTVLWENGQNPWLQAWQSRTKDDHINLIVPKSDISDRMDVPSADPAKISVTSLKRIKARYGAQDAVILAAVFDQSSKNMLTVDVYRTDAGKPQFVQKLNIPRGNAAKLGELLAAAVTSMEEYLDGQWKSINAGSAYQSVNGISNSSDGTQYATAADYPDYRPETSAQSPVAPSQSSAQAGTIKATVAFRTMAEWLTFRRALNNVPQLQAFRLIGLSTNRADMQLDYSDWNGLVQTLNARGIMLQPAGPGAYTLSRTAG